MNGLEMEMLFRLLALARKLDLELRMEVPDKNHRVSIDYNDALNLKFILADFDRVSRGDVPLRTIP